MTESFNQPTLERSTTVRQVPILVFAHGTDSLAKGGGSGFRNLVERSRKFQLPYVVVGVCTPYVTGSVADIATSLKIPVYPLHTRPSAEQYCALMNMTGAAFAAASGYLWPITGLPTEQVINIHPASFSYTAGLHGDHAHERMIRARDEEGETTTHVTMHFVTPFVRNPDGSNNYDTGPVFAAVPVKIESGDTVATLKARVNAAEHRVQPAFTALVATGAIKLLSDGTVWMEDRAWYEGKNLPYT